MLNSSKSFIFRVLGGCVGTLKKKEKNPKDQVISLDKTPLEILIF